MEWVRVQWSHATYTNWFHSHSSPIIILRDNSILKIIRIHIRYSQSWVPTWWLLWSDKKQVICVSAVQSGYCSRLTAVKAYQVICVSAVQSGYCSRLTAVKAISSYLCSCCSVGLLFPANCSEGNIKLSVLVQFSRATSCSRLHLANLAHVKVGHGRRARYCHMWVTYSSFQL